MTIKKPLALFYAGTNGAGKSTMREIDDDPRIDQHIDPDAIAKVLNPLNPRSVDVSAGRQALAIFKQVLQNKVSFSMETTLTGRGILERTQEAKSAGYEVELRYIGLPSPNDNNARIATRVAKGGHDIDKEVVFQRYKTSLENLPQAIGIANRSSIWDNSGKTYHACLVIEGRTIAKVFQDKLPTGLQAYCSQSKHFNYSYPYLL